MTQPKLRHIPSSCQKAQTETNSCPRTRRHLVCFLSNFVTRSSERLPYSQFGFVQLRLRVSNGAIQDFCDLLMLIAFDFVQQENCPVPRRQFSDRSGQGNSIHRTGEASVLASIFAADRAGIRVEEMA
jgi:hypothetical protein